MSRYLFHRRDQRDNESVEQYITNLKILARECAYTTTAITEEMIRDSFVCGISTAKVREKLLQVGSNLTLSQAITIARAHVETQVQLKTMSQSDSSGSQPYQETYMKQEIHFVKKSKKINYSTSSRQCYYCGGDYSASHKCPAKGKICSNCDKPNHLAKVCKSTKKSVNFINQQQQNHDHRNDSSDELFIDIINKYKSDDQPYVKLLINKQINIIFKIDTGGQANIIPERFSILSDQDQELTRPYKYLPVFEVRKSPHLVYVTLNAHTLTDAAKYSPSS